MDSLLQKTSSGNITEVIEDKNSSDSSSEEDWYDEETSTYEKIGMILIQYEDLLNENNLRAIVKLGLFNSDQDEYMFKKIAFLIKKYKEKVSYEIMNKIVEILTDKVFAINIASYEELIEKYESVVEDYYSVIKDESIIIYLDLLFEQSVKI
tara:strand:- start:99 stop:554 length:456 start_codon:yes stop_codon:yes gene_type:complete